MIYALKFTVHVLLVTAAFIAAYTLRRGLGLDWWVRSPDASLVLLWAIMYGGLAGAFEFIFKNERRAWSYASIGDIARLVRSTGLVALTFLALIFISNRGISLPRSTLILSWLLSLSFLVSVRLAWRLRIERSLSTLLLDFKAGPRAGNKSLVLVGSLRGASLYLKQQTGTDLGFDPVAIVSSELRRVGQWIDNVPVVGDFEQLEGLLHSTAMQPAENVAVLFLEDPVAELHLEPGLIGRLRKTNRPLLRLPSVTELRSGSEGLREISLEEFLPREPVTLDPAPVEALVTGRKVLVTGAGGSIGSEICRQLVALGCSHISLVDSSEFLLFEIDRSLGDSSRNVSRKAILCDVRDSGRLEQVFSAEKPEIVFHAAALKHVTLVENNPKEAVLTNVLGTWNVAEAARKAGALQFVLISTDKAVNPTSFMGATKRLAESTLPLASSGMRYCAVRFGNVLGSAGSVVPIFRRQIERGGPVTVTHPDVERYFMTIPEAVQLVLHAAAVSATGDAQESRTFILEMGKPVRIHDLAKQMIELSGRRPNVDIQIEFTGLKPGEKLTEELLDGGEVSVPIGVGLSELQNRSRYRSLTEAQVRDLASLAREDNADSVVSAVTTQVSNIRGMADNNS